MSKLEKMREEIAECQKAYPGWAALLHGLEVTIADRMAYKGRQKPPCPNFEFAQIKEKFGSLRIYTDGGDEVTDGAVSTVEVASERTCMICGKMGTIQGISWLRAACPEHADKPIPVPAKPVITFIVNGRQVTSTDPYLSLGYDQVVALSNPEADANEYKVTYRDKDATECGPLPRACHLRVYDGMVFNVSQKQDYRGNT